MGFTAIVKTAGAWIYAHRAVIETVAGMALVAGGTAVVISKARQATDVYYDVQEMMDDIHSMDEENAWESKKERNIAVRKTVCYATKGYLKCYALGVGMEVAGLALIGISDMTMSKELAVAWGLVGSYAATIDKVKNRVIADQGEGKWNEYYYGPQSTQVEVLPDGTVIQTTTPIDNPNRAANLPPFTFIFDESNPDWEKDPVRNLDNVLSKLRWLRERLRVEGFLWLNDILRDLKMPLVECGWTAGIFAEDSHSGKNLSFGFENPDIATQRFLDGLETNVLLKINVVPNINRDLHLAKA